MLYLNILHRIFVHFYDSTLCITLSFSAVTLKNVADIAHFAVTYGADQLKKACLQFICINATSLLDGRLVPSENQVINVHGNLRTSNAVNFTLTFIVFPLGREMSAAHIRGQILIIITLYRYTLVMEVIKVWDSLRGLPVS